MSYKKRKFRQAINKYDKDLAEIASLNKKLSDKNQEIENSKKDLITKGLLYYDHEKRNNIISKAEALKYSNSIITKLRKISSEDWNPDNIDENTIKDFQSMEMFVNDNTPRWEKSILSKLGNNFIQFSEENDDNND